MYPVCHKRAATREIDFLERAMSVATYHVYVREPQSGGSYKDQTRLKFRIQIFSQNVLQHIGSTCIFL